MRYTIVLISCILFFSCNQSLEKQQKPASWKELIKDEQLNDWSKKGNVDHIYENGILELSGKDDDACLIYDKVYNDFTFQAEFLLSDKDQAGILFRYNEQMEGNPAYSGYHVNLDHNQDQQNVMGSIFNVARAKSLQSTSVTDWNTININATGDHLQVMINDTLVAETHNRRMSQGLIGLQVDNGSMVKFRNVKVLQHQTMIASQPVIEDYMRSYSERAMEPLISYNDLKDWRAMGDANWNIRDGVIHGYSNEKGGFLIHKKAYRNFYLRLKFKIKHEDNSGIFIRHDPADTDLVSTDNAIECNIYDHDGYLHAYSTGSIAPIARSWSKMINYDDWNDMEIFAFEDQICMFVNGTKSAEAHLEQQFNKKGEICIQGGIQVFNGNLPSDIYIKDMFVKDFDGIPFIGF